MLSAYVPIAGLFALAALFAIGSVAVAPIVGPRRYNKAKLDAYECGIEPTPQPVGGMPTGFKVNVLPSTFSPVMITSTPVNVTLICAA